MSGLGLTRSCLCETRVPEVLCLRTSSSRAVPRGSLPSPPLPWGACWTQQSTWHQAPWGKARRGQPSSLGACDGPRCQTARPHGRQGQSMWTRGPDGNLGSPSGTTLARLVKPTRHQGRFAGCLSPTPVLSPGESHGRRSLVGYRPWGRKESDTTERLHFHFLSLSENLNNNKPVTSMKITVLTTINKATI